MMKREAKGTWTSWRKERRPIRGRRREKERVHTRPRGKSEAPDQRRMKREGEGTCTSCRKERGTRSEEDEERSKGCMHFLEESQRRPIRGGRRGKERVHTHPGEKREVPDQRRTKREAKVYMHGLEER
jgi:hypothetical protein